MTSEGDFTLGVEEEYLVVDPDTRAPRADGDRLLAAARAGLGDRVSPELQASQLEVSTAVSETLADVRADLEGLRRDLSAALAPEGAAIAATGSHPFASWRDSRITEKEAYLRLERDYQQLAREQLICGCHVHVGIADPEVGGLGRDPAVVARRERVAAGRGDAASSAFGGGGEGLAQADDLGPQLAEGPAHGRPGLDLGELQLVLDGGLAVGRGVGQHRVGPGNEPAGLRVDEEELLFDPQREVLARGDSKILPLQPHPPRPPVPEDAPPPSSGAMVRSAGTAGRATRPPIPQRSA